MNSDSPRAPDAGSGSVRASSARMFARPAKVAHALAPSMNHPLRPSCSPGVALQVTDATSEPTSGSVTETPTNTSPVAIFGSQYARCSSVPPPSSAFVKISDRVIRLPATSDTVESSSVSTTIVR